MKFNLIRTVKQIPIPSVDITHIGIHHSASSFGSAEIIDGWHLQRWTSGLGYHFIIHNGTWYPSGVIETGRNVNTNPAAHKPKNSKSIAICVIGNFDIETCDKGLDPRFDALAALVIRLMNAKGLELKDVYGHRELKPATHCPGLNVDLDKMRNFFGHWRQRVGKINEWYDGDNFVYTESKDQIACVQRILNRCSKIAAGKLVVDGILGDYTHQAWSDETNILTDGNKGQQALAWEEVLKLVQRK